MLEKVHQFVLEIAYPLAFMMQRAKDHFMWFNSYITTYIERDIRSIGELREIDNFIRFFNILAPRSANILNKSNIANDAKLNNITVDNYLSLLEKVYQIHLLKPYYENIGESFIKSPKVYLIDSGISSHVLNISSVKELGRSLYKGDVYETFVFAELLKHINYSENVMEFFTSEHKIKKR